MDGNIIITYFGGSNDIFVDCIFIISDLLQHVSKNSSLVSSGQRIFIIQKLYRVTHLQEKIYPKHLYKKFMELKFFLKPNQTKMCIKNAPFMFKKVIIGHFMMLFSFIFV